MADEPRELPKRMIGANLPAEAYLTATAAGQPPTDDRWCADDKVLRLL